MRAPAVPTPSTSAAMRIERPGHSQQEGKFTDRQQRGGPQHGLPRCEHALRIDHGQHRQAGARVVLAIHPGDGEEVRQLPQEHQQKQRPRRRTASRASRRRAAPADERRQRAWNRADHGRERLRRFRGV